MRQPTLKPCPFCGKAPDPFYNGDGRYAIVCQHDEPIVVEVSSTDEKKAVEAWNRRAPVEITEEMVERAEQVYCNSDWRGPAIISGPRAMRAAIAAALNQGKA